MAPIPRPKGRTTRLKNSSSAKREVDSPTSTTPATAFYGQCQSVATVQSSPHTYRAALFSDSESTLENLPIEVFNHILSYLDQPRSRLPGLSEQESSYNATEQRKVKNNEDLLTPPDTARFAADLFSWTSLRHPFNTLAASSRRCRALVESYCSHLVKTCNRFNLPFAQAERYGADSVYPGLSGIIYRRLWLQTAPRDCLFCGATLSHYPHRGFRLLLCCADCFYAQTLSLHEVKHQYHIMDPAILTAHKVRATSLRYEWILRIDVEALALKLYGTRAFHDVRSEGLDVPCSIPKCQLSGDCFSTSSPPQVRRLPSHVTRTPVSPARMSF